MASIKKFDRIRYEGMFRDFGWTEGVAEFSDVNVLYGGNGAGKSTLARLLRGLASSQEPAATVEVLVEEVDGSRRGAASGDAVYAGLCVFDRSFVAHNHDFDSANPSMPAVLTLGEKTIEQEAELASLREGLPAREAAARREGTAAEQAAKKLDGRFRALSRAVVDDLAKHGGRYRSPSAYTKAVAERRLADFGRAAVRLSPQELADAKQQALAEAPALIERTVEIPALRENLLAELALALEATPVTLVLDTLSRHPEATGWVRDGRALHRDSDDCLYCGAALTPARRADIEAHFSDAVSRIERGLADLERELVTLRSALIATPPPHRSLLYADLGDKYDLAFTGLSEQVRAMQRWIDATCAVIAEKLTNVLRAVDGGRIAPCVTPDAGSLNALIAEHDARVQDHSGVALRAAERVERHHLALAESEVRTLAADRVLKVRAAEAAAARLTQDRTRIAELSTVGGDPGPSAQVLQAEVARLLGRDELVFTSVSGGRYSVTRSDGTPAGGLSEGERTAITLVHFLETVARRPKDGPPAIVVVDDPVTSLDSNVFLGVSTYLWTQCIGTAVAQLFILTHDFELFRQCVIQMGDLPKRLAGHAYELRSVYGDGPHARRAEIVAWADSRTAVRKKRFLSAYHHAFILLADGHKRLVEDDSTANQLTAQLLLPNVLRRVLEAFVAFKCPGETGNFSLAMMRCLDALEGDVPERVQAVRLHLTRFAHTYSHDESPDTTRATRPGELRTTLTQAFWFMALLDEAHFRGLCELTGQEADVLLGRG